MVLAQMLLDRDYRPIIRGANPTSPTTPTIPTIETTNNTPTNLTMDEDQFQHQPAKVSPGMSGSASVVIMEMQKALEAEEAMLETILAQTLSPQSTN